jgi:hypothetical protein
LAPVKLFGLAVTQAKWFAQNPIIFCFSVQAVQIATRKNMQPAKQAGEKETQMVAKNFKQPQMIVILCFWVDIFMT